MDTVIQVLIGIVIILIALAGVFTATSLSVDSAEDEVEDSTGVITSCLSGGIESEDCSLFGGSDGNGGGG